MLQSLNVIPLRVKKITQREVVLFLRRFTAIPNDYIEDDKQIDEIIKVVRSIREFSMIVTEQISMLLSSEAFGIKFNVDSRYILLIIQSGTISLVILVYQHNE